MRARWATGLGALLLACGAVPASARVQRPSIRLIIESTVSPSSPGRAAPLAEPGASTPGELTGATNGHGAGTQSPGDPSASTASGAAAWGEDFLGQLGTFYRDHYEPSPVGVEGLGDIVEVSASEAFNLALLSDGTIASWGGNGHGQLGDDEKKPNWEDGTAHVLVKAEDPVTHEVSGDLQGVVAVSAANEHALALMQDGTVMAWGNDEYGQLGDGQQGFERTLNLNERLPKPVPGLTGIASIATGGGSDYAVTSTGTVMAWGSNTEGQLGLGSPGPDHCETGVAHFPAFEYCSERPRPVMWRNPATGAEEPLSGVKKVYAGQFAAYAVLQNGHLLSWGGNHFGELGTGADTWRGSEFPVSEVRRANGQPLTGVTEVAAGYQTAFVRLEDGEVLGWGSADRGALAGLEGEECRHEQSAAKQKLRAARGALPREPRLCVTSPTQVPALERLHPQALAAGHAYGLALSAGVVYSWGSNEFGQLGLGRAPRGRGKDKGAPPRQEVGEPTPTKVKGLGEADGIVAGGTHAVALLKPGVAPPPPLVSASPAPFALSLSWRTETSNGKEALVGERLLYRASGRAGEPEPAEQGKSEDEQGPPTSIDAEPPRITLGGEPLEGRPLVEGERLNGEPGAWSGARPIVFTYQWQRCNPSGESCVAIAGAKRPGYRLSAEDDGATIRVLIIASGPEPPASTAASAATSVIASAQEDERARAPATSVNLDGLAHDFLLDATIERVPSPRNARRPLEVPRPLQGVPYEVRFIASRMTRVMVLTPLASG